MRLQSTSQTSRPIEPIGMINVIFLLLIFFLVAGSLAPRPPDFVDLARLPADEAEVVSARLDTLALDAGGNWFAGRVPLAPDALAARLAGRGGEPLTLYVDRAMPADRLSDRLGTLAALGVKRVRVMTLSGDGS